MKLLASSPRGVPVATAVRNDLRVKGRARQQVGTLDEGHLPCGGGMKQIAESVTEFGVEVPPLVWFLEIVTEPTIGPAVIRREHPCDEELRVATFLQGSQEPVLEVVVDIAEVLIFHRIACSFWCEHAR